MGGASSYPAPSQLRAEARYYAAGKFTYGWLLYFVAFVASIFALVTGWRAPWWITLVLILGGLSVHVYGMGLRWYILGRIPVANMFEAVVGSAALGIGLVLLVELVMRSRVLLVGASALGFAALVAGQYVLPGSELGVIPGILDDIQLRVHTVLIIWAYALIFVAAIVAIVYLIGYAVATSRRNAPAQAVSAGGAELSSPVAGADANALPAWLNNIDWAHFIIINILFVFLFVGGIVLGAWWADYSWGRPWGWDPKEVFALNTWLIYAILLHTRIVVRRPGLWTAWLSIAGCIMMCFNWFFVNFFISSVHSYV
jgi:cytochrome c-type biogenesis protein CcsB